MANAHQLRQKRLLSRTKEKLVDQEPKRNRCDGNVDRISSLPDKAISKILACLPIKEAVGTCKLSRTWRYRWMSIPEFVFDEHAFVGQASDGQRVSFINNLLLLHEGDITKFEIRHLSDYASPNVDRWLLFLSTKRLINLLIGFQWPITYVCHTRLFSCQVLSTLKLKYCGLQLPPLTPFNGFKNLTVLDLEEVNASRETIEFLVNTSPLLENLSISEWISAGISDLNISATNLRKCVIHGKIKGIITFVKTPELRDTDISLGMFSRLDLDGIVGGLVKIQKAAFSHPIIQAWRKNFTYHHLNHLKLEIDFEDPRQVLAALWLSKSSPSLKTIDIRNYCQKNLVCDVQAMRNLQALYDILSTRKDVFQSLETFDLGLFGGSDRQLKFIQFFLLHASVLQTMKIGWKVNDTSLNREKALMELVQFQRASPGVKIKLYDSIY